jgi:predicted nuclease with TOPRIM domain
MKPLVPISAGELIDKLSILDIKERKIRDELKLANVRRERLALQTVLKMQMADDLYDIRDQVNELYQQLTEVNDRLWVIEDEIRDHERRQSFAGRFVELARSVYIENDRRAMLKRQINELTGSELVEEKSYSDYRPREKVWQDVGDTEPVVERTER